MWPPYFGLVRLGLIPARNNTLCFTLLKMDPVLHSSGVFEDLRTFLFLFIFLFICFFFLFTIKWKRTEGRMCKITSHSVRLFRLFCVLSTD